MKRLISVVLFSGLLLTGSAFADEQDFIFGTESKGVTVSSGDTDLNIRVRIQPRLDYGDIIKSRDGKSYSSTEDFYFRRIRLEMTGSLLTKTVKYNLTLKGDKWDKAGNANEVKVHYAYVEWEPSDAFGVSAGKEKLPYSRVSLTTSARRLLVENPVSTEDAKKLFGPASSEPYYQPRIEVKGKFLEGAFAYTLAVADGWQSGEAVETGLTVFRSKPLVVGRVEASPPGLAEGKKSDAHLGKGRHLTFGADFANQGPIEYKENGFKEKRTLWGLDLSGHYEGFTAQLEYNAWKTSSTDPSIATTKPKGWYAQAGYFIAGPNIEPAVRYELYDQDSAVSGKKERDTTLGANWYLKGHSMKIGLNWVHTKFDGNATGRLANDDKKDVYQLQGQIYF